MANLRNVLIISYSRPLGVQKLLESCLSFNINNIYISLDGPKDSESAENQKMILNVIEKYSDKLSIHLNRLDSNHGVGLGVIHGLDWFFQNVESGVILEDDLNLSRNFFPYIFDCLEDSLLRTKVMMISGTRIFHSDSSDLISSHYPMIWGWATWAESWQRMREALLAPKRVKLRRILSSEYWYWRVGAQRVLNGSVDTWDTPLAYEFFLRNWQCVYPPENLVSNIGYDKFATHTTSQAFPLGLPIQDSEPLVFDPSSFRFSQHYTEALKRELYKVRFRHLFLWIWAFFTDIFIFPRRLRKEPLRARLQAH